MPHYQWSNFCIFLLVIFDPLAAKLLLWERAKWRFANFLASWNSFYKIKNRKAWLGNHMGYICIYTVLNSLYFFQVGGSSVLMLRKWAASVNESDYPGKQNGTLAECWPHKESYHLFLFRYSSELHFFFNKDQLLMGSSNVIFLDLESFQQFSWLWVKEVLDT